MERIQALQWCDPDIASGGNMINPVLDLYAHGQSVWLSQFSRRDLRSGLLSRLIDEGEVVGVTCFPSDLQQEVCRGDGYDDVLAALASERPRSDSSGLYRELTAADTRKAADLLAPIYNATEGADGYASCQVPPTLAYDTEPLLKEAHRLWSRIDRPNAMIGLPATDEALPAVGELLAEGISVDVCPVFSRAQYLRAAGAYIDGLERLVDRGGDLRETTSVVTLLLGPLDAALQERLPEGSSLPNSACVANAKLTYRAFRQTFLSDQFAQLSNEGAQVQRLLLAPRAEPVDSYLRGLVGPHTVAALPLSALEDLERGSRARLSITEGLGQSEALLEELREAGVELQDLAAEVSRRALEKQQQGYRAVLEKIERLQGTA